MKLRMLSVLETHLQHVSLTSTFKDDLSKRSVERCRGALANGLNSLARSLGEQFRLDD